MFRCNNKVRTNRRIRSKRKKEKPTKQISIHVEKKERSDIVTDIYPHNLPSANDDFSSMTSLPER